MMDKAFLLYPTVNKTHSKKRYKAIKDIAKEFKVEPQRELKAIDGSGKRDMPNHEYLFIEACAVLLYFFKPETDRRQKLDLVHNMEEFLTEFPDFKHASIDDETGKVLAEHEQAKLDNKFQIAQQIANHLGPHASTADQSYVSRLAELRIKRLGKRERKRAGKGKGNLKTDDADDEKDEMQVSQTNNQQPPAPPGAGAIPVIVRGSNFMQPVQLKT